MSNHRAHWPRENCLRLGEARERSPRAALRGFTLVELLVTISVISVLIGILIPTVAKTRNAARGAACLSNLRQIGVAWNAYLVDYIYVPYDRTDGRVNHVLDWGGVDWYDFEGREDLPIIKQFTKERAINPYLGAELHQTHDHKAFLCPADHGLTYHDQDGRTEPYWSDDPVQQLSTSELRDETIYGVRGSSYTANDWLWVKPGFTPGLEPPDPQGYGARDSTKPADDPRRFTKFTDRNQLSTVSDPSKLIIVNDADDSEAWRVARGTRHWQSSDGRPAGMQYGGWHGYEWTNASFLDGSARHVKIEANAGVTPDYTFWLQPELHGPGSATIASKVNLSRAP